MELEKTQRNDCVIAVAQGQEMVVTDAQSALDLLMEVKYTLGTKNIAIAKEQICRDFFILSSGLAGEILQKYVNYGGRIAIYGDFSAFTSKPLHDFIYESNKGHDVFFVPTPDEALTRLE